MVFHRAINAAIGMVLAFAASAQAADIDFGGNISTSCTIVVNENGTLVQDSGARRMWTSPASGGTPGRVSVTTTGYGYVFTASNPGGWASKPAADTTPTSMTMVNIGSGATTFMAVNATPRTLNLGTTSVLLTMTATKPVNTSFANGNYRAVSTVTCQ